MRLTLIVMLLAAASSGCAEPECLICRLTDGAPPDGATPDAAPPDAASATVTWSGTVLSYDPAPPPNTIRIPVTAGVQTLVDVVCF